MRMHVTAVGFMIMTAALLNGCSSPSIANELKEESSLSRNESKNPDLISTNGELFPLSTYFGVCMKNVDALRSKLDNGMLSPHFPSYAELTGSGGVMKISVGKFGMMPGTTLKDIPVSTQRRRIQLGRDRDYHFVLVSDFGAGSNIVSIVYDGASDIAKDEAIRIANNVVPCHLSIGRSKENGL